MTEVRTRVEELNNLERLIRLNDRIMRVGRLLNVPEHQSPQRYFEEVTRRVNEVYTLGPMGMIWRVNRIILGLEDERAQPQP